MKSTFTKGEKYMLFGLVVCVVGGVTLFKKINISVLKSALVEAQVNYKMGKVAEEFFSYSLQGREISRIFESENELTLDKQPQLENEKSKKSDKKKDNAKKSSNAQVSNSKNSIDPSTPPSFIPQTEISNLQNNVEAEISETDKQDLKHLNQPVAPNKNENAPVAQEENDNKKKNKVVKTYEQIKSEFLANPSKEAVVALVSSLKKEEVTSADFYKFNNELLSQNDQTLVGYGLYALRLNPSYESFIILAQYQTKASESYQAYIEQALLVYNQASYVGVLQNVIKSNNKIAVLKALDVVEYGITQIKGGNVSQLVDERNKRDTTFSAYSLQSYVALLPAIAQAINSSPDAETLHLLETVKGLITDNSTQVAAN